ncbi:hypothetical protein [Dactylosporangium sp. NPDC051484]|uniref:hypothetical protein n=1 Tax=Dactylosporangium sp. NPDC051484 TaxID=3154942 RepID=UPI00344BD718
MIGEPDLTIDYLPREPVTLRPEDEPLYLDRRFLAEDDLLLSRRPNAPLVCFRAGDWWLDNECRSDPPLTVFVSGLGRRFDVPNGCSFRLRSGDNELHLWRPDLRVLLTVSGRAEPVVSEERSGPVTMVGLPNAHVRLQALFERNPRYKLIMAAHYREYLTPGIERPQELSRQDTAKCCGGNQNEVTDAKRAVMHAIWGEQGHGERIAAYLINRGIITRADQSLVPHRDCIHRRPRGYAASP